MALADAGDGAAADTLEIGGENGGIDVGVWHGSDPIL
jgi:hypothetical protein